MEYIQIIIALITLVAQAAPEVLKLIQGIIALFTGTSEPIPSPVSAGKMMAGPPSNAPHDALKNFFYYVKVARAAAKSVDDLDFGLGEEGNKDARYDTVYRQVKQHAVDLGDAKTRGRLEGIVWVGWMLNRTDV